MIRGILALFSQQAYKLPQQSLVLERECIKYSDYAISLFYIEREQSLHYCSVQVGPREWIVRRTGIVTDKMRRVFLTDDDNLACQCRLYDECHIACRHLIALCRDNVRFRHRMDRPCGDVWLNSKIVDCFKEFHVIMPSLEQEHAVVQNMFPDNIKMPKKVATRGRPRVKRIKTHGVRNKKKGNTSAGGGGPRCAVCRQAGHTRTTCPARKEFAI